MVLDMIIVGSFMFVVTEVPPWFISHVLILAGILGVSVFTSLPTGVAPLLFVVSVGVAYSVRSFFDSSSRGGIICALASVITAYALCVGAATFFVARLPVRELFLRMLILSTHLFFLSMSVWVFMGSVRYSFHWIRRVFQQEKIF